MAVANVELYVSSMTFPAANTAAESNFGTSDAVLVTATDVNDCASLPAVPCNAAFTALALSVVGAA